MYKKGTFLVLIAVCLFLPHSATAKPLIAVEITSEKEIVEMVDGKKLIKLAPAPEVEPGQILIFTLYYANNGDEKATNVVINNPIPEDTAYLVGSAFGENSKIIFSIDSGQTFKKPSLLKYEIKSPDGKPVKKTASPEQYTDIRWIVHELPAGQKGKVGFKVKVK